ncbi:hypothetical protein JP0069_10900 [Helicobacter pylori]|nr:hypothetical protein JP0069_10900 [Helicobacter pylori]
MGSIGSMGKPIEGFLVAAIQFPVPIVNSRKDIDHNIVKGFLGVFKTASIKVEKAF